VGPISATAVDGILSAADQIPHGFFIYLREMNRRQFPGAVQASQIAGSPAGGRAAVNGM
jgi:hypothetical protein